ncbi:hypothetical protein [Mycolicibacterium sp. PDY-3]|uniref:hypothetical protein n=1 Tax=Mycolicibacterium sp. PDY-3 TaxID=3376069 RepID=UPI0037873AA0
MPGEYPFEVQHPGKYELLRDYSEDTVNWINNNADNDYARNQMLRAIFYLMFGQAA